MRIAILYICTGKYACFFDDFYRSAEKYMLQGVDKRYFVFSDNTDLTQAKNVTLIKRECKGFPMDSLMRFDMFLSIADELKGYDYTFFFNANMLFVAPVGEEILPKHLAAVIHPGYYNKPSWRYPYERNKHSKAYIPAYEKNYRYYMGSFNGGKTEDYLQLSATCNKLIHEDMANGIIARFHDESHLNHYLRSHECLALSPSYAYIENKNMPFEPKIIIRDKTQIDSYFDKGRNHSLMSMALKAVRILWGGLKWYF